MPSGRERLIAGYLRRRQAARAHAAIDAAWRSIVFVIGLTLIILGAAMLVLPGPGWPVVWLALAVLGSEFAWARRLLKPLESTAAKVGAHVRTHRAWWFSLGLITAATTVIAWWRYS